MKKKDIDYFEMFIKASKVCERAAASLNDMISHLDESEKWAKEIHDIEHEGDELYHVLYHNLNRSFITPIEREDILGIARAIESAIDTIDEAATTLNIMNVKTVRAPAIELLSLITKACAALIKATAEFKNFKKSKTLPGLLVEINNIEEEGDAVYQRGIKNLFSTETNALEVVKWQNVYNSMEEVLDAFEDAADLMEGVIINNT